MIKLTELEIRLSELEKISKQQAEKLKQHDELCTNFRNEYKIYFKLKKYCGNIVPCVNLFIHDPPDMYDEPTMYEFWDKFKSKYINI
jgi:hypothetical protein